MLPNKAMSTSPSWFDKDKFSRLVKKPGSKGGAVQPPPATASSRPVGQISLKTEVADETPEKKENGLLPEKAEAPAPSENAASKDASQPEASPPLPAAPRVYVPPTLMTSQLLGMGAVQVEPPLLKTKSSPEPLPPEPIRAPAETANISLTAKNPPLEAPLPTLPRRTAPLPALKSIFQYEIPEAGKAPSQPSIMRTGSLPRLENSTLKTPPPFIAAHEENSKPAASSSMSDPVKKPEGVVADSLAQSSQDLALAWEKITQLNEDLRKAGRERDQAVTENGLLREQLKQTDGNSPDHQGAKELEAKANEELIKITQERDELTAKLDDIGHAIVERDRIRGNYAELREQFEAIKQAQIQGRKADAGLSQELETARQQLTEREQELESLRTSAHGAEEDLRRQLTEREQAIDGLKASAKSTEEDLRKQIEDRNKQLDERGKEIESNKTQAGSSEEDLRRQLTEREQAIDGLKASAKSTEEDLRKQIEDRDKQIEEGIKQLDERGRQFDERNREIESHKSQAGDAEGDLRRQLTERDRDIDGLKTATQKVEEDLRRQLTEKEKEIETAKASSTGLQDAVENLKKELAEAQDLLKKANEGASSSSGQQEQIAQLKEEASISQRGLALSQKALQETRDALRQAQETMAQTKTSQDNLKKENSTLVQQNMLLQAQNDQVSRELSAAKAKLASKG